MTSEDLILAIAGKAPQLNESSLRLLIELVAQSIELTTPDIPASSRELAASTGLSREGVMRGARDLHGLVKADIQAGKELKFHLPPSWFPSQRALFPDNEPVDKPSNWPTNLASAGQPSRPVLANYPGQCWPNNLASDGATGQPTRPVLANHLGQSEGNWPNNQASSHDGASLDPRARVRSIESGSSVIEGLVRTIDRAWGAVEIPASLETDAALLAQALFAYKQDLGPMREESAYPDTGILARLLALAPYEKIHCVLRSLRERQTPCGDQDAWFFTVMAQKIHHASPKLTRSRMEAAKVKPPSNKNPEGLFGDQLLTDLQAKARRLG